MADWDGGRARHRNAAKRAYAEAGITDPRAQLSMMKVHDCFWITGVGGGGPRHLARGRRGEGRLDRLSIATARCRARSTAD
ncbi:hypothetical protein AB5I41_08555 [Sphingomonas sp. MMS24-JH45]